MLPDDRTGATSRWIVLTADRAARPPDVAHGFRDVRRHLLLVDLPPAREVRSSAHERFEPPLPLVLVDRLDAFFGEPTLDRFADQERHGNAAALGDQAQPRKLLLRQVYACPLHQPCRVERSSAREPRWAAIRPGPVRRARGPGDLLTCLAREVQAPT